jgi:hypothetical protein
VVCLENEGRRYQPRDRSDKEREMKHIGGAKEESEEDEEGSDWEEGGEQSVNAKCEVWRYCQTLKGGPCPFLLAIPEDCGMGWMPDNGNFRL